MTKEVTRDLIVLALESLISEKTMLPMDDPEVLGACLEFYKRNGSLPALSETVAKRLRPIIEGRIKLLLNAE